VDLVPHLDAIADLGVGILQIMPITDRGGNDSMYSVHNYTAVDRELGTLTDFKYLVDRAHTLGIGVILDFVPNHTANNHPWVQQHPDWYVRDANGDIVHPHDPDASPYPWRDVSQLNWRNANARLREELWAEMERIVTFWVQDVGVDGFRWDSGMRIPGSWYVRVRKSLERIKPVFFLVEGDSPNLHPENDMSYDSLFHVVCKRIGIEGAAATELDTHLSKESDAYGSITPTPYRMRLTLNHDLSYMGNSEFADLAGQAATLAFEVLSVTIGPHTKPMLYSGQEIGIRRGLEEHNRVTTNPNYNTSPLRAFYRRLLTLYKSNPALHPTASFTKFDSQDTWSIYAFGRSDASGANKVVVVANLSATALSAGVTVPLSFQGTYTNVENGDGVTLGSSYNPSLAAWGYRIFRSTPTQTATFPVAFDVQDQSVGRSGANYPPTNGAVTRQATDATVEASKNREGSTYVVRNILLMMDTASIPDDATITGARLRFWCTDALTHKGRNTQNGRNFVGEYYGWDGTSQTDWSATTPASLMLFSVPIANIVKGAWNEVELTDLSGIGKTGATLIRCHVSGGAPTGYNYVAMAAFEDVNPEAQLVVEYTVP
jgi:hypothetical protein